MSKTETTETTNELKGSIKAYNLETLALVDAPYTAKFTPANDVASAMTLLGNDEKLILSILNGAAEAKALSDGKANAFADGKHVPKTSVLKYINQYRTSPMFSGLVTVERGKEGWKEQYSKQTEAILSKVKDNEFIMSAIRAEKITDETEE